ncbi:elongation of very long chain fatty acids protein 5-like isoform X2 [Dreissena polymorpha]|uniref:elongation of very long chain fatty acids protein 5-like isoform X2 n=1 Tax=Dreissena polymorpha TaxID=45954 RepID=UPI00226422D1|nr:elongation of very long chain fatty acids protein 5-like isoform X2 [Dreissena polymorpha]
MNQSTGISDVNAVSDMGVPGLTEVMEVINDVHRKYADPRTKDWFMLFSNPVPVWLLTAAYLGFVMWLGPRLMRDRKPFSLQTFMVVYNIGLVIMSVYMFVELLLSTSAAGYKWLCSPYNENTWKNPLEQRVANILWYYTISKAIELLDTVLMIMRKKDSQVTFLHLFHHSTMLNIWWWVQTFIPGGQSWFSACLNCLVHVVMYLYYGLAVIPALRDKLWWKKYITTFQLVQFVITLSHTVYTYMSGCDFPLWGQYMLMGYMVLMLVLFGNFYVQSYIKKKSHCQHRKKTDSLSTRYANGSEHVANGSNGHINGNLKDHPHVNGAIKRN